MLRKSSLAVIVTITIALGSVGAHAQWPSASAPSPVLTRNQPPLAPAGAAGIRAAQGIDDIDVWFVSGIFVAAIVWVLFDDDDDVTDTTE